MFYLYTVVSVRLSIFVVNFSSISWEFSCNRGGKMKSTGELCVCALAASAVLPAAGLPTRIDLIKAAQCTGGVKCHGVTNDWM